MAIQRMDNVGIVVADLDAAVDFFAELGMEVDGRAEIEGPWADKAVGLTGIRCAIAMMRTPDGHGRLELAQYLHPQAAPAPPEQPHNIVGTHRVMFAVDDIHDTIERLRPHGGTVVDEVAQYEDVYLLCYLRGPGGILIGLAERLGCRVPQSEKANQQISLRRTWSSRTSCRTDSGRSARCRSRSLRPASGSSGCTARTALIA